MIGIPIWAKALACVLAITALLGLIVHEADVSRATAKAAGAEAAEKAAAHEREVAAAQAQQAAASAATETARRVQEVQGNADVAEIQARAARADADAVAARARGLQHALDAIRASGVPGADPAASDELAHERGRSALLADLLTGADDLAGRAAAEAGELRPAGDGCERSWDGLRASAVSASAPGP